MGESNHLQSAAEAVRAAVDQAAKGLVERRGLVETVALAAVAREHVLVIGPPGTAKSEAVRRMSQATGGQYFEYLIGRFTEPSEIFGPVDLRKLREGLVETQTGGMLPEAEIAFLDEIFLGSTAILNTLLGILQERVFRRGHTHVPCPLRICVGASNRLPESELLAAFADRFLVHIFTEPIPDSQLEELLSGGRSADAGAKLIPAASMRDLDLLADEAKKVDLSGITSHLAHAIRQMRSAGVVLTDRRVVKMQRLLAAAAVLDGRTTPSMADIWTTILAVPSKDEQMLARDCLKDLLTESENSTLSAAAEEISRGPLARAARIVSSANELLTQGPTDNKRQWLLKLEGIAREIDAGYAAEMPAELQAIRSKVLEILQEETSETHSFAP